MLQEEPRVLAPAELELDPRHRLRRQRRRSLPLRARGRAALRFRRITDDRHVPRARFHAQLASDFGPAEAVEPMYLRVPDADKTRS